MKSKRVLRYYCDHCRKSGCNSGAMRKHEERCFANPERACPLCKEADFAQQPIRLLVDALRAGGVDATRVAAKGCAACVVAAITQERKERGVVGVPGPDEEYFEFDYRSERDRFLNEVYAGRPE